MVDDRIDREKEIIENQDEKVKETIAEMTDKNDVEEFKNVFKSRYSHDWDQIVIEFKDDAPDEDGTAASEQFLEELFKDRR